ncbi:hypothetical protein ACWCPM_07530 [Streptomyces sp. NPDC002309]
MTPLINRRRPRVHGPRPRYVAVTALAGLTVTPGAAHDAHQADSPRQGKQAATSHGGPTQHHVTLITGDRVTVEKHPSGRQSVSVQPAQGREHIKFIQRQNRGAWPVIPVDALPLLTAGPLDGALFNVSALAEGRHADRAGLPLIVE